MIPHLDKENVRQALQDRAEELFREAWGEPEKTGAKDWRARSSSARSMIMRGPKRGLWRDHKTGAGGDVLDLFAVEFCGLSRAQDDFPRVIREAAAWAGLSPDMPAPDRATLEARRSARQAQEAAQAAAEAQADARLVEALQARAQPLSGSPAAAYLASRGITAPPPGWSYLPPVPGAGVSGAHRAALVAWAIDGNGTVTGGQRILILPDGSKAPDDPRKPSFGRTGGAAARIPARIEGGPLCIAEGPETAAAIAQATGFETWAVFGFTGFATAPAPIGRQVILCPDRDAPGSPAADGFAKGCEALAWRGVDLWIAEAPEPAGSKRDLADTLQDQGPEAVAAAVKDAVKFTPRDGKGRFTGAGAIETADAAPMPDFQTPAEAENLILREIGDFLERAAAWQEGEPPPVLALAASPGAGKSTLARKALARFDLSRFAGDVLFHAPTLQLAEEAAADAERLGAGAHVTRGRNAINPATGETMCQRPELPEAAAKAGLAIKPTTCEREKEDGTVELCPHHASCAYIRQWAELQTMPALRFEATAYIAGPGDGSQRPIGLRVIDESFWRELVRVADLPIDRWLRPRQPQKPRRKAPEGQAEALAADTTRAAGDVLAALQDGRSPLSLPYTAEDYRAFAQAERPVPTLKTGPGAAPELLAQEVAAFAALDPDAGKRAAVWQVLAEAKEKGLAATDRLRIVRDVPSDGTGERRELRVTWLAEPPRDKPVLSLDADADPDIIERLYPGARIVRAELRPNAHVVQMTDRTFSKAATLDRPARTGKQAIDNRSKRRELAWLVRAEVYRDRLTGGRGVLAIATRELVRAMFADAGHNFPKMSDRQVSQFMRETPLHGARWLWFGPAALGLNDWRDFGTAIVIGREELPLGALQDQARAMFGDTGEALQLIEESPGQKLPKVPLPVTMADGSAWAIEGTAHPDRRGRALQMQAREWGARQTIERLRLAHAPQQKRVIVACSVPIPGLPVNELATWQDLAPDRLRKAMVAAAARGGVLRLSATGLAKDAPEVFATERAAEAWLAGEGRTAVNTPAPLIVCPISGAGGLNPARVRLKVKGQRGPVATPALVVLPGDPRALAEAQLGELAAFEVLDPGNLSAPAPIEAPAPVVVPADALIWKQAERNAADATKARAAIEAELQAAPDSAAAQVLRAIDGGAVTAEAVATATQLQPDRLAVTLARLIDAGMVLQAGDGGLSLRPGLEVPPAPLPYGAGGYGRQPYGRIGSARIGACAVAPAPVAEPAPEPVRLVILPERRQLAGVLQRLRAMPGRIVYQAPELQRRAVMVAQQAALAVLMADHYSLSEKDAAAW
jgi:hypothetical protein